MSPESGRCFAEWFWNTVSHEIAVKFSAAAQSSEGLTEAEGWDSRMAPSRYCQLEASVSHMDLFIELMRHVLTHSLFPPEQVLQESKMEVTVSCTTQLQMSYIISYIHYC